jgi:hypothetical protein
MWRLSVLESALVLSGSMDVNLEVSRPQFSYLDEANVRGLLTEALTADVEAVLADQTGLVGADTAVRRKLSN